MDLINNFFSITDFDLCKIYKIEIYFCAKQTVLYSKIKDNFIDCLIILIVIVLTESSVLFNCFTGTKLSKINSIWVNKLILPPLFKNSQFCQKSKYFCLK